MMDECDSDAALDGNDDEVDDVNIMMNDNKSDEHVQQAWSSSSSTFLQQLVAQRTAFAQVKQ